MILALACLVSVAVLAGCSEHGFNSNVDPVEGDTAAAPELPPDTVPATEPPTGTPTDPGLRGGHFDVDTTTSLDGTTEGHFHEYDDEHDVSGIDFIAPLDTQGEVQPLEEALGDVPDLEFVIVVVNPDLSPGARLVLDGAYDPQDPSSWVGVGEYADTPLQQLERHTLRTLPSLGLYFAGDAIQTGGLAGTEPTCVSRNDVGPGGEWRNGALVVQAIRADQLQTNVALSAGGVQGAATAGLLWEGIVFWHWPQGSCR
jgi:hypothetical protein